MSGGLYYYDPSGKARIVKAGKKLGRDYAIVTTGKFPSAYVCLQEGDPHDPKDLYRCSAPHGGFTHMDREPCLVPFDDLEPLGEGKPVNAPRGAVRWHYGHYGDYTEVPPGHLTTCECTKEWTVEEIERDIEAVCGWLEGRRKGK